MKTKLKVGDYIKNTNAEGKVIGKLVNIHELDDDDTVYCPAECQTDNWMIYPIEFVEKATDEEAMLFMLEN